MYPPYWTPSKEGIFMRYSNEYKKNCIELYRQGKWPETPDGIKKKNFHNMIRRWERRVQSQGPEAVEHGNGNRKWTTEEKMELVSQVLAGKSNQEVALSAGINSGTLYQWVQKYLKYGEESLRDSRGRHKKGELKRNLTELEKKDIEIERLKRELERHIRTEEILKKNLEIRKQMMKNSRK